MAIRIEPNADVAFGIMTAEVVVTHVMFQKAGANPVVKQLSSSLTVAAGRRLRLQDTHFDVVYPSGELTDAHMKAVVDPYWVGQTIQLDCLTNATTVVSDSGYSQQTHDGWTSTTESD